MVPVTVTALTKPTAEQLAGVAEVFDQYRRHYGQPVVAGQTLAWLSDHTSHRRLSVFAAHVGEDLAGLATTVVVPASLRLGCSWQLRDLYVVPGARRRGAARALVFASAVGTPLDPSHVRRDFRKAIRDAPGLNPEEWTPRELRHSFVSLLSDSGVPLEEISRLVGHSTTAVTELVYRQQIRPVLQSGASVMDRIFDGSRGDHGA